MIRACLTKREMEDNAGDYFLAQLLPNGGKFDNLVNNRF